MSINIDTQKAVSLLHTARTSRPSYLDGKRAEHRIEKPQTYTTSHVLSLLAISHLCLVS